MALLLLNPFLSPSLPPPPHTTPPYPHAKPLALRNRDIAPVAPTHVLIIPKLRNGLTQLRHATADHAGILGYMLEVAAKIAKEEELEGFRYIKSTHKYVSICYSGLGSSSETCAQEFRLNFAALTERRRLRRDAESAG